MQTSIDERKSAGLAWAQQQLGITADRVEAISSDASFRRYFRLITGDESVILMDAPPEREPVAPFIDIAQRLHPHLRVPEVLAANIDQGFLLLSDLGDTPYHHILNDDNAEDLFKSAMDSLLTLQTRINTDNVATYEPALLMRELDLFLDWFIRRHWQVEPSDDELDEWDQLCALLIRWALDQAQVFCHRDFMPRNLMLGKDEPGILDFQDAVIGPISYDPVCLFRDAFLSWPQAKVDAWLEHYRTLALKAGLDVPQNPELWRRTCDFMGTQRHLKVIGIFARIRYRDGKARYLDDHQRFFAYLEQSIARNSELSGLAALLRAWSARRAS